MLFPTWCLHICNYLVKDNSYRQSDCRSEKPLKYFFQRGVYIYGIISERIIATDNLITDLKSPWNAFPTWCLHICNYLGKDNSYRQSDCRSEKPLKCCFQRGVYIYAIISERIIATDNLIADLKSPWNTFSNVVFTYMQSSRKG